MSQFIDDFLSFVINLISKSSDWIKKLARFLRFLLVLIQVLIISSLKYFSLWLIFKRSCKFHEFQEFFSKWKQQLFTYAVRMGTLSVFYCLILSKLAQLSRSRQFINSVMCEQNKNCQFAAVEAMRFDEKSIWFKEESLIRQRKVKNGRRKQCR